MLHDQFLHVESLRVISTRTYQYMELATMESNKAIFRRSVNMLSISGDIVVDFVSNILYYFHSQPDHGAEIIEKSLKMLG